MVVNTGANTSTGAIPCTRRRKQTRASYFVAVYRFRGETPTLIFNGYLEAARRCIELPSAPLSAAFGALKPHVP